jgi:tetratricopeptide (TPR) repeat protein
MRASALSCVLAFLLIQRYSALAQESPAAEVQQHARRAQQFLQENQPDQAIEEFRAILALEPNNVTVRGNLGTLLYFRGDYEHAVPELRTFVKSQPSNWKTITLLGMCEKRLGNVADARTDLEKAFPQLTDDKLRVQAGLELVELYYASRDLDKAASVLSKLRKLKPDDPAILFTAHRIYAEQADEATLGIAMLAPNSAWMHQLMGQEMMAQGNIESAITHYREAVKLNDRLPGLHFEFGEVLSSSSSPADKEQAAKEYEIALAQNPFDEKAECRLGRIAALASDMKAALARYARAVQLRPDDPEANLGIGKTLLAMNEPQKAQPFLEKAVALDPSDASAHYQLGTLYRKVGRAEDARRELAEFQRLKQMKEQLKDVYKVMRRGTKPDQDENSSEQGPG